MRKKKEKRKTDQINPEAILFFTEMPPSARSTPICQVPKLKQNLILNCCKYQ